MVFTSLYLVNTIDVKTFFLKAIMKQLATYMLTSKPITLREKRLAAERDVLKAKLALVEAENRLKDIKIKEAAQRLFEAYKLAAWF